jgi:hypothetical protein
MPTATARPSGKRWYRHCSTHPNAITIASALQAGGGFYAARRLRQW